MEDSCQDLDPVRPGEQWFCYWKTSASLWESRIREFPQHEMIFIPVYWGFHAEAGGAWDFGQFHPERDLVRLSKILTQHNRRFCWLLPLTPAPFLPNGGVPISVAKTLSLSAQGMHLACLDQDNTLHKMYSFYEPKVLPTFASFVENFGVMLSEANSKSQVWGAEFYFLENKKNISFLDDSSVAFEQGFSRYLKKNYSEPMNDLDQLNLVETIKHSYVNDVKNIFQSIAQEALAPYWEGIQGITMFGASPRDTIERAMSVGKSQTNFFKDLFENYVSHRWFSTSLLTTKEKKELLRRCLNEHFANDEIEHQFHYLKDSAQIGPHFRPYALIDVFDHDQPEVFDKNGLKPFINENFRWMFYLHNELDFTPQWIDSSHHRVKFFHAQGMDRIVFSQMLKLFMMGQRIIFDCTGLSEELDKRLQIFYLENNLKLQSINFLTSINLCELGDGRFITYEGGKFSNSEDKNKFWNHIFKFLNMNHPEVHSDEDIFSLWRIRATSSHELNYLDVRRVNFYNPTSYKKSVMVHTQKKFAFMKVIDPMYASAKMTNGGVEVELLPNGKLALDFGHYEERT